MDFCATCPKKTVPPTKDFCVRCKAVQASVLRANVALRDKKVGCFDALTKVVEVKKEIEAL